jgi:uncharacterized repeat protein (TIGR01451 family)
MQVLESLSSIITTKFSALRVIALAGLLVIFSQVEAQQICARPGNEGSFTSGGTVNSYYAPATGITIAVDSAPTISLTNKRGATSALAAGDLVMVIQMQCADINSSSSSSYGSNTGTGRGYLNAAQVTGSCSAGTYEYLRAAAGSSDAQFVPATPFKNNYAQSAGLTTANNVTSRRTFQVIRIPQYSAAVLGSGITTVPWDGLNGGVIAMDVAGSFNFNGQTLNAQGQGFRGGGGVSRPAGDPTGINAPGSADPPIIDPYRTAAETGALRHASKGEGIAGTPRRVHVDTNPTDTAAGTLLDLATQGYPDGDWGKGAPGNAGGGGEDINNSARDNGGGGGGGNAGIGGNGGYGWRNAAWAGFNTSYVNGGGLFAAPLQGIGGDVFAQSVPTRIVMGGGGGAGGNNNNGTPINSSGAAGGGIVMIRAQSFSGSGSVNVAGARAPDQPLNDGAGGGGAGGSVVLLSTTGSLGSVAIDASGGRGGDSWLTGTTAHGGGGGGGGGYIVTSSTPLSTNLAGGAGAVTNTGDSPPGGANHGAQGGVGAAAQGSTLLAGTTDSSTAPLCKPILTVTKSTTTPTRVQGSDTFAEYRITISNAPTAGEAQNVALTDDLPPPFTYTAGANITVTYAGGATGPGTPATGTGSDPFTVGVAGGAPSFTIPGGATVTLALRVNIGTATFVGNPYQNTATTAFLDPTRVSGSPTVSPGGSYAAGDPVGGSNYTATSTTNEDISILRAANLSITKTNAVTTVTAGGTTSYNIDVTNAGPSPADNSVLRDTPSSGLQCTTVSCTVISGSACPVSPLSISALLGSGITIPNFSSGSTLRFTVQCNVTATGQ